MIGGLDNIKPTIDFDHIRRGSMKQVVIVPKPIQEIDAITKASWWMQEAVFAPDVTKPFAITKGKSSLSFVHMHILNRFL